MSKRGLLGVVLGAAFLSQAAQMGSLAPIVVGLLLVGAIAGLVRWRSGRHTRGTGPDAASFVGPLGISWLVLAILPVHSFSSRTSEEAATGIGLQPVLELLVFVAVGLVAAAAIRTLEPTLAASLPPVALFLLPVWIVASSVWSATAPYAFVRGCQMAIVAVLAWATVALGRVDPAHLRALLELVLRWLLRVVVVLVLLGVAFGPIYATTGAANAGRFTWIGAHPNGSGLALSVGIVVALVTPRRVLRLPPIAVTGVSAGLLWAMYENHSRTSWICIIAGLAVAFALRGTLSPLLRWAGTPLLGAAVVAATYHSGDAIWDYALREGSSSTLATGNGRKALWGIGFRSLDGAFDWLCGLGYGVTRTLFIPEEPWAGDAHNSVLALIVSVGLVGVALFLVPVVQTVRDVVRARLWTTAELGIVLVALLVLVFVNGTTTDVLAEPTIGFVVFNLVAAVTIVQRSSPTGAERRDAEPSESTSALDLIGGITHGR